jgi:hypothetical protein
VGPGGDDPLGVDEDADHPELLGLTLEVVVQGAEDGHHPFVQNLHPDAGVRVQHHLLRLGGEVRSLLEPAAGPGCR